MRSRFQWTRLLVGTAVALVLMFTFVLTQRPAQAAGSQDSKGTDFWLMFTAISALLS